MTTFMYYCKTLCVCVCVCVCVGDNVQNLLKNFYIKGKTLKI